MSRTIAHTVSTVVSDSDQVFFVLIAAIIAAGVALFGHLVSRSNTKLQAEISRSSSELSNSMARANALMTAKLTANVKLAEMRQNWINNLRSDMADFQSLAVTPNLLYQEKSEFYKLLARIELSMNPDDQDYEKLSTALYAYIEGETIEHKRENDILFIAVCQSILKREWDVLKKEVKAVTEVSSLSG